VKKEGPPPAREGAKGSLLRVNVTAGLNGGRLCRCSGQNRADVSGGLRPWCWRVQLVKDRPQCLGARCPKRKDLFIISEK
jgi:hypothetical protein